MHGELTGVVFVIMTLLFAASLVALGAKRIRFPYTILLVIAGLALGWASRNVPSLGYLTRFALTPDVVLYILLPVLVFESAFNIDVRSLLKNLTPILVLAVPAVLISTAIVAGLTRLALPLSLGAALLFGALISATDPVAVIALFKEMGAPKRLTMLVEGESLFNDGTALVLFAILLPAAISGVLPPAAALDGAVRFVVVFFGGAAVGAGLGFLFAHIIGRVENNRLVEITLTTILAHSSFLFADHVLHLSGVMATVGAGLMLGSYGRSKISPQVLDYLEAFWDYAAYVCNSLIFLLVGLGIDLAGFAADAKALVPAVLAVILARVVAVYGLFPVIERFRRVEPVDLRFQTVIVWGGLRGVLAVAMAVSIPDSVAEKPLILHLTLGIVLFTLLVNGLTMRPLMGLLALDRFSLQDRLERLQALLLARQRARDGLAAVAVAGMIRPQVMEEERARYDREIASVAQELQVLRTGAAQSGYRDEEEMVLRHVLLIEKTAYHRLFVQGLLGEENLKELRHHIDVQLDRVKEGSSLPGKGGGGAAFGLVDRLLFRAGRVAPFGKGYLARIKTERIAASYERKRARLMAAQEVLQKIDAMQEQRTYAPGPLAAARAFYLGLAQQTHERVEQVNREFPEYVGKVEQGILQRAALNRERETVRDQYDEGALSEKSAQDLEEDLSRILGRLHTMSFLPGEEIVREGERGDALYLIGRGAVEVTTLREGGEFVLAKLGAGAFFGEIALLTAQPRTATVRATTPCTLLELRRDLLLPVLAHAPALSAVLETAYRERVLATALAHVPALANQDEDARRDAARAMEYAKLAQGTLAAEAGTRAEGLFVIKSGEAESLQAGSRTVLGPGSRFNEDGLAPNAVCKATVRALTDLEVYVLRPGRAIPSAQVP